MPIIPNRSLKHNKFKYLGVRKRKHDFLELAYPGLRKWLWEIPPEQIQGKYIPFEKLDYLSYNSKLSKGEWNNALLDVMQNIWTNAKENLSAKVIVEKYKKLADMRYKKKKKLLAWGEIDDGDDDDGKNGLPVAGIYVEHPW